MNKILHLSNVTKEYNFIDGKIKVLNNINFDVKEGETVAIMGESGAGKSTLLNIIGLLDDKFTGEYFFDTSIINQMDTNAVDQLRHNKIGFVFQDFKLIKQLNVLDNVMLPLTYKNIKYPQAKELSLKFLEMVGLKKLSRQSPQKLSGGQKQRVSIARAMVTKPDLLIADEPTGALDSTTSKEIMSTIKNLTHINNTTVTLVTHDPQIAKQADKIVTLKDGKIIN